MTSGAAAAPFPSALKVLGEGVRALDAAGVPSARHDAEELLAHALGMPRAQLRIAGERVSAPTLAVTLFRSFIERRARREPLQYIVGTVGFRTLELLARPGVFIPRPETESLAGLAIEAVRECGGERPLVLELGTGTGAVAISIASEINRARVVATDLSAEALALADENARRCGVKERVSLVRARWLSALRFGVGRFHVIVSNPPYVPLADMSSLMPEVRLWEPATALAGGEDGMIFHEEIARKAVKLLAPRGTLLVEVADGQASAVARLYESFGYRDVRLSQDLAGVERVVSGRRREEEHEA